VTHIQNITSWHAPATIRTVYEKLLLTMGTEEFGSTVRDSVLSFTAGARRIYLFEATGRIENNLQYFSCEPGVAELFPIYNKRYLALDPIYDAYRATPECSDVALLRIRPSDIPSAGFRRRFFEEPGIVERLSIVQRGADAWRVLTIARHADEGLFSNVEIDALVGLACLALPMLPLNRTRPGLVLQLTVEQFEDRFASRYPALTARERQVCARAVLGMSIEATALDLGIGKTSVLTYRQRAYQRLQVANAFQLCALVSH